MNKFSAFITGVAGRQQAGGDGRFLDRAILLAAYARKYDVSPTHVEHLIQQRALAATMIEGLWMVEDQPPSALACSPKRD